MATKIWPSENDVFDVTGGGRKPTEDNLTDFANSREQISLWRDTGAGFEFASPGGVVGGWDFVSGDATSFILTAGIANIRGYRIEETANTSGVLVANSFNYIFLTLDTAATLATGRSYTVVSVAAFDDDVTIPVDSILLYVYETGAGSITNQFDFRAIKSSTVMGHYIGDGAASRFFDLGFRPKKIEIVRNESPFLLARSPYQWPRDTGVQRGLIRTQVQTGAEVVSYLTSDPEIVPILFPNGFTVEDGPGSILAHRTYLEVSKTFRPPGPPLGDIVANGSAPTTMALVGAAIGDQVHVNHDQATGFSQNAVCDGQITVVDVVQTRILNTSGSTINLLSGTLKASVWATGPVPMLAGLNETGIHYYFLAWF